MARRVSTGVVGKNVLGALSAADNIIISVVEDEDIIFDPSGTGEVLSTSNIQLNAQSTLKLADTDSTNWIGLRAPATVASNVTLTFPATAGTSGYVLTTNGSGVLSWENVAVQVNNSIGSDTNEYNVLMTSATSGGITTVNTVSAKITFKPSDGTLFLKNNTGSTSTTTGTLVVTGGVGISENAYIGGTMQATTITETSSIALKENIVPIENALEKVLQLAGVTYDRKDGSSKGEAGLIKEEVEKVLPNLVSDNGIYYTKLTAYLIEAVKELKAELSALKSDK